MTSSDRLNRALDLIDRQFADPLDLETVASAAALSPFHFARLFRRLFGDSVMGYVRRRRLQSAAESLLGSNDRILDIALAVGFESQEAFHRAFKRHCGITPGGFRKLSAPEQKALMARFHPAPHQEITSMTTLTPSFQSKAAFTVMGLQLRIADGNTHVVPGLWQSLAARAGEIPAQSMTVAYGLCEMLEGEEGAFDYLAGFEVLSDAPLPEGMARREVPALDYAVFTHKAHNPDLSTALPQTMQQIFAEWLPASDYELSAAIDFEYYDDRFDPQTMTGEIDIYVPVHRRA